MKQYERTENGTVTNVSQKEGMDEINHAMMAGRGLVRTMSSIARTDYAINYKDGRRVRLVLVDAPEEVTETVAQNGDRIEARTDRTALVTLSNGKTYIVATHISRKRPKNEFGTWVPADNTSYWTERNGREFGATMTTSEDRKPKSVGGRIWALLVSAGIA